MIDIGFVQLLIIIALAGTFITCGFIFMCVCVYDAGNKKPLTKNKEKIIQKFMYIEDGSVDTDELIVELGRTNPEIKVIVYRHGSQPPKLFDV